MKKFICIILLIAASYNLSHATKRALVIGIGNYPEASGWAKINGDKDIPMVKEMLTINGFAASNIVVLKNEQATCRAIKTELENLITHASFGDFIYIHFSGHGQQITDLNGDEVDDQKDEAWIPYDAQFAFIEDVYEGENHLVDDQINAFLHRLRSSVGENGKIIVVADACHSGDGTRSGDDEDIDKEEECIRGTEAVFTITNIKQTINRFAAIFINNESNITEKSNISKPEPTPLEWIYISACQDYQCNREYKGAGSLTTALFRERMKFNEISLTTLHIKLKTFYINNIPSPQRPMIESPEELKTEIFF